MPKDDDGVIGKGLQPLGRRDHLQKRRAAPYRKDTRLLYRALDGHALTVVLPDKDGHLRRLQVLRLELRRQIALDIPGRPPRRLDLADKGQVDRAGFGHLSGARQLRDLENRELKDIERADLVPAGSGRRHRRELVGRTCGGLGIAPRCAKPGRGWVCGWRVEISELGIQGWAAAAQQDHAARQYRAVQGWRSRHPGPALPSSPKLSPHSSPWQVSP